VRLQGLESLHKDGIVYGVASTAATTGICTYHWSRTTAAAHWRRADSPRRRWCVHLLGRRLHLTLGWRHSRAVLLTITGLRIHSWRWTTEIRSWHGWLHRSAKLRSGRLTPSRKTRTLSRHSPARRTRILRRISPSRIKRLWWSSGRLLKLLWALFWCRGLLLWWWSLLHGRRLCSDLGRTRLGSHWWWWLGWCRSCDWLGLDELFLGHCWGWARSDHRWTTRFHLIGLCLLSNNRPSVITNRAVFNRDWHSFNFLNSLTVITNICPQVYMLTWPWWRLLHRLHGLLVALLIPRIFNLWLILCWSMLRLCLWLRSSWSTTSVCSTVVGLPVLGLSLNSLNCVRESWCVFHP